MTDGKKGDRVVLVKPVVCNAGAFAKGEEGVISFFYTTTSGVRMCEVMFGESRAQVPAYKVEKAPIMGEVDPLVGKTVKFTTGLWSNGRQYVSPGHTGIVTARLGDDFQVTVNIYVVVVPRNYFKELS